MHYRRFIVVFFVAALAACGGSGTVVPATPSGLGQSSLAAPDASGNEIPKSYRCLPSGLPGGPFRPNLAYISQCLVAQAPEGQNLEKLAIALMYFNGLYYRSYCTGTPIAFNPATNVGFVVTAAHCVVGGPKGPASNIAPRNITTFDGPLDWVYQGSPARLLSPQGMTGKIISVYVPARYCRMPSFDDHGCSNLAQQNGDIAVLQIQGLSGNTMRVLSGLRVGGPHLTLGKQQLIMALGYGQNNTHDPDNGRLYYVDYHFFAKDNFQNVNSAASLMNGYFQNSMYYNIICRGDSGGGDFAWTGTGWALVGDHSWGAVPCGTYNRVYRSAADVSADVRPWQSFIQAIVDKAKQPGCASLGPEYVCRSRK
jgi:hypothetical protein